MKLCSVESLFHSFSVLLHLNIKINDIKPKETILILLVRLMLVTIHWVHLVLHTRFTGPLDCTNSVAVTIRGQGLR